MPAPSASQPRTDGFGRDFTPPKVDRSRPRRASRPASTSRYVCIVRKRWPSSSTVAPADHHRPAQMTVADIRARAAERKAQLRKRAAHQQQMEQGLRSPDPPSRLAMPLPYAQAGGRRSMVRPRDPAPPTLECRSTPASTNATFSGRPAVHFLT
jgi:hypothetical protein